MARLIAAAFTALTLAAGYGTVTDVGLLESGVKKQLREGSARAIARGGTRRGK